MTQPHRNRHEIMHPTCSVLVVLLQPTYCIYVVRFKNPLNLLSMWTMCINLRCLFHSYSLLIMWTREKALEPCLSKVASSEFHVCFYILKLFLKINYYFLF